MNYCIKHNMLCELANAYGYCQVTACSKYLQKNQIIYSEQIDTINFPQTIGNITFYTNKELMKTQIMALAIGVEVKPWRKLKLNSYYIILVAIQK